MVKKRNLSQSKTIKAIIPLKRNNRKFDLIISSTANLRVSIHTILKYNLKEGLVLSESDLDTIISFDQIQNLKDMILNYLSYRSRSKNEILLHFLKKGFQRKNIEFVIEELESKGYVNDEEFAKIYASNLIEVKLLGINAVMNKFHKHKINRELVDKIVSDLYEENPQKDLIKKIINKKFQLINKDLIRNQRIINYLKRKGFLWEEIVEALNQF